MAKKTISYVMVALNYQLFVIPNSFVLRSLVYTLAFSGFLMLLDRVAGG